ncbi:MAG: TetR family transcriptional regulator [Burkholderiaceae bacterium]
MTLPLPTDPSDHAAAAQASRPGMAGVAAGARDKARPTAARRTQSARRELAERRLLDAALRIVARRGSVRMTLAEVGEAAGYSRGLPAHRFGNKAGLVHALAGYIGERFGRQRSRGPAHEPGLSAILGAIDFYFSRNSADFIATRALLVMMTESCMTPAGGLRGELAAYNRNALAWFEQQIRIGIERAEIAPGVDPSITATILLGAMRGVMQQWLVDKQIDLPAVRDRLLQITEQVLRSGA